MAGVNISFLGVCTIFHDLQSIVPPNFAVPSHRVVLPIVTQELTGVDPHFAKIQFIADQVTYDGPPLPPTDPPQEHTFSLAGVSLTIFNAAPNPVLQPSLSCLPSLQAHLEPPVQLGPPAQFVYIPDANLAAAWFDVSGGNSWNAYLMNADPPCPTVPSISILNVSTAGAPQLLVVKWDRTEPTIVTLSSTNSTPAIYVMNFAMGQGVVDDNNDFLLNYLTATTFPPVSSVNIPQQNQCITQSPGLFQLPRCGDAGPGCSNTLFP